MKLMLLALRTWTTRLVLLYALWLLLVGYVDDRVELYCGIVTIALAAAGLHAARRQLPAMHVPLRATAGAWRLPWEVVRDSLLALGTIPRRASGTFRSVELASGDDPQGRGLRAYAEARGSLAPNAIVVDVDPAQDLALLHVLDPRVPGKPL